MTALGQKALDCLILMDSLHRHDIEARDRHARLYAAACERYSEKAVIRMCESLVARGYAECGVSARTGWLTEKGRQALAVVPQTPPNPHAS